MFKWSLLFLTAFLYSLDINAQYVGGANDGFGSASVSGDNASPNIYKGGSNDGFSFINVAQQNAGPTIYKGGANDGFSFISVAQQNAVPNIYTGGINDGVSFINVFNQNTTPNIYQGGNNDGFAVVALANQNATPNIYTGGKNDGVDHIAAIALNANPGIYVGGINDGWASLSVTNQNPTVILALSLNLKLFIQGFYLGNNLMEPVLYNNTLSNDPTACDSITVKLYDAQNPVIEVASVNTLLHSNGIATISFPNSLLNHSIYIVVKHRNSIETWSKLPVIIGTNTNYNFTVNP